MKSKKLFEYFKLNEVQEFENGIKTLATDRAFPKEGPFYSHSGYTSICSYDITEWVWLPSKLSLTNSMGEIVHTTKISNMWFPVQLAFLEKMHYGLIERLVKQSAAAKEKIFYAEHKKAQLDKQKKAAAKQGITLKEYRVAKEKRKQELKSIKKTTGVLSVAPDIAHAMSLFQTLNKTLGEKGIIPKTLYNELLNFMGCYGGGIGSITKKLRKYHLVDK